MVYTALLISLVVCSVLIVYWHLAGSLDRSFRYPIYLFVLGLAFVYGFVPLLKEAGGIQTFPAYYGQDAKIFSVVLIIFYAVSCAGGYVYARGSVRRDFPAVRPLFPRERRRLLVLVGLPSLLALAILLRDVASYDFSEYMKDRIELRRGMGPIVLLAFMSLCYGSILIVDHLACRRSGVYTSSWRIAFVVSVLGFVAIAFAAMGNRNFVFILLFVSVVSAMAMVRVRIGKVFAILPILVVIAIAFSVWAKVRVVLDSTDVSAIAAEGSGRLLTEGLNGAFGNAENLVWLLEYEQKWEPLYGLTFLAAAVNPVPRVLWPDKPFGGGPALRNFIYPGSYVLGGDRLTSYTTGLPAEAYMNFKLPGLLFLGLLNGAVLAFVRNLYANRRIVSPVGVVVYGFSVFMFAFGFLYMEILGGWSRYLIVTVLLLAVAWLGNRRIRVRHQ